MHERRATGPRLVPRLVTALSLVLFAGLAMASNERLNAAYILADRGSGRFDIWYVAFRTAMDHPLLGVGRAASPPSASTCSATSRAWSSSRATCSTRAASRFTTSTWGCGSSWDSVGLALFLTVLVTSFILICEACRALGDPPVFDALIPMLLGFMAGVLFLSIPNNKVLWILVGFSVALDRIALARSSTSVDLFCGPTGQSQRDRAIPVSEARG